MRVSDNTAISMPMRNLLSILAAVAVGVWAYFGVIERINSIENDNVLTFALSETSMVFKINYTEKGIEKRSIIEANDERMEDSGKELAVEKESEDTSEIIWNQIEVLLGKRFF